MTFATMLNHRATFTRRDPTALDRLGDRRRDVVTTIAANVPCRLSRITSGGERFGTAAAGASDVTHRVYFEPVSGVTIGEGDRISQITEPGGAVIAADLDIKLAARVSKKGGLGHHIEVTCRELRDGEKS